MMLCACAASLVAYPPRLSAATITVANLNDSGPGSLRQAIADASPRDTIDFTVTGTVTLTSGELVITNDLTINGPGATNLTVSGNSLSRVFQVPNLSTVTIRGLTVADGLSYEAAGVLNYGMLTLESCTLSGNHSDSSSNGGHGGAINHHGMQGGTLTIIRSLLQDNSAGLGGAIFTDGFTTISASTLLNNTGNTGGGIWCSPAAVLSMTNTTISGNAGGTAGGGILQYAGSTVSAMSCTICSNTAGLGGGIGTLGGDGLLSLQSSILAGNAGSAPDMWGSVNSGDFNLIGNTNGVSITGVTTHNIYGQDPLLGPLADNGGPTPTHALLPASPAIDHGSSGGLATDQRGRARPNDFASMPDAGDGGDIGAFELQGHSVTTLDDNGPGSLRQAIADAAPGDTIDFAVTGTITLTNGELVITNDLAVAGPGVTNLTVSGNNASRVFNIAQGNVTMSGLTITGGKTTGDNGITETSGGGILSLGNLTLSRCVITNNTAGAGWSGSGGGIFNGQGRLVIRDSVVSSNYCLGGGGIACASGPMEIVNTTISGNMWAGCITVGPFAYTNITVSGNGIGLDFPGTAAGFIVSSTIVSNSGPWNSQGIQVYPSVGQGVRVRNTIVFGNSPVDGTGPLTSLDYNLVGNTNGMVITGETAHNLYGVDPLLGSLADNGGPTPTHALLPGSPAIDSGSSGGLATDQRGRARPNDFASMPDAGDGGDIGGFELQGRSVTTLDDSGPGSLRQAIADAAPGDTIDFAVTGTITLTSGELVVTNDLKITGPGITNLTVSGNNASRVLLINSGVVNVSGMTIANGTYWGGGAGIYNLGTLTVSHCLFTSNNCPHYAYYGGGICNIGNLTVRTCTFSKNFGGNGGGIGNVGTASVFDSTLTDNGAYDGGGVRNDWGSLTLINTTVSGNHSSVGGGLESQEGINTLRNCTIVGNSASHGWYGGGGIWLWTASTVVNIHNSIVAGNSTTGAGPDCSGPIASLDFNLIGNTNGATITGVTTHNIYGKDPLLGPLADNGGPTPTHALLPGSPAIDHGSSGGLATDQRGLPRPFNFPAYFDADDGSDIGAVEMQEGPQSGPVFTVNSTNDVDDGVPGIAHCSLREAINAANATPGTNSINFATAIPGLVAGVTGTITLTNGQLTITNSVNISGPGAANLTVSGNNMNRIFQVGDSSQPTVVLSEMSLTNGSSTNGAGILNKGILTVSNCALRNCFAHQEGGAIDNWHRLTLFSSTISANSATTGGGGILNQGDMCAILCTTISSNAAGSYGGGIYLVGWAPLTITNSTLSGNTAPNGGGIGIDNRSYANTTTLVATTICSNTAVYNGGGVFINGGGQQPEVQIHNSIIAGNSAVSSGPDCWGTLNSFDYNLIQNTNGCTITNLTTHNIYNQDPKLGPLADLGGPTPTHALRFDSPAIDAGHSGGLTTDQRGLPRPIDDLDVANAVDGDGSDIGAYEADPNLLITAMEKAGPDIRMRFNTLFGKTYRVEFADEVTGAWNVLSNNITGTGSRVQALDMGAASLPQRFYRGVLLP